MNRGMFSRVNRGEPKPVVKMSCRTCLRIQTQSLHPFPSSGLTGSQNFFKRLAMVSEEAAVLMAVSQCLKMGARDTPMCSDRKPSGFLSPNFETSPAVHESFGIHGTPSALERTGSRKSGRLGMVSLSLG